MINNDLIITKDISLLDALKRMNDTNRKLLIVCEDEKFLGVVSIGDIQRALLSKMDLSLLVSDFLRENVTYVFEDDNLDKAKQSMVENKIESMPVVDRKGNLKDVIEWNQLFNSDESQKEKLENLPVVIMAGGKGTRLLPLTNVIPKPLIPISDKTIMEEIMTQFKDVGCSSFYISVNYMMETIKEYFSKKTEWNIEYIQEDKPLGTGGSLYLLKNKIDSTFFVSNCDTLIDIDLFELVKYHKKNGNIVTAVSAVKTMNIPYGTIETKHDGIIKEIREKPDFVFQINSGLYVLEPEVLDYVEDDTFLNITDLILELIDKGERVGAFPVNESSWIDMGNWNEYLQIVNDYLE